MFLETKEISRVFKEVSSVFQENFKKKFQGCFKKVSMKFCARMYLIAATRAEGGLVFILSGHLFGFDIQSLYGWF